MPWSHTLKMKRKKLQFSKIKSFHNEINRKTTGKRYKNFENPLSCFFSRKFTLTKSQIHCRRMGNPLSKWKLTTFHFNWNKNMFYSLTNQITSKYYLPFTKQLELPIRNFNLKKKMHTPMVMASAAIVVHFINSIIKRVYVKLKQFSSYYWF